MSTPMSSIMMPDSAATRDSWSLTEAQQGLWYAQQLAPDNPSFNCAHALWIDGDLDVPASLAAANQAAEECQSLALAMRETAHGIEQYLDPRHIPLLEAIDLQHEAEPVATAQRLMQADMATPVDPTRDALARQCLYRLGAHRWCWYQRAHHLSTDGYGMALWSQRVAELLAEHTTDAKPRPPLSPWADVVADDEVWRSSDKRLRDGAWWRDRFTPMPEVTGLAAGHATAAHGCHRLVAELPSSLHDALQEAARHTDIGWPDLLTALTALYCQRMAGVEQTVLGIPFMGRMGTAAARASAITMNVLPLLVAATPDQLLTDFVESMARAQLRARRHGRYRSEQLRRDLGLLGGQRRLHAALINVQPFYQPLHLPGCRTQLDVLCTGPVDDLTLGFRGHGADLALELEANPDLYTLAEAQAHLDRLPHFLQTALRQLADGGTVEDVALASPAEAERHLFTLNASEHPVGDISLTALVEQAMGDHGDAIALASGDRTMRYSALEKHSRAGALALRDRGVGSGDLVAVALPRSLDRVVALLAVLRAGAAWLPLDTDHPRERLARVIELAAPACVLTDAHHADHLPRYAPVHVLEDWPQHDARPLATDTSPDDAAYVIYTSGSTGEPKGVVIEHRAIVNRLLWMRTHYGIASDDRILQKTPATFDVSVWEFFLPLIAGATLVIAEPGAHRDPARLAQLIRRHRISTCHFVPSMLEAFLDHPDTRGLALKRVFVSGEALPASLRQRFHATLHSQLHNLYGPTEAAIDVSAWQAGPEDDSQPVPIGRPVWNTRLYVLDTRLRPQPPGVPGDLYIGGVQLARGYLGRDDLTRAAFRPDPHRPGERIYKTGDVASWRLEEGALVFLGRSDHQVKLRGLRIELGEIEAALESDRHVSRAVVMLHRDSETDPRLVAWVQPSADTTSALTEHLRQKLAAFLPDYMVPAAFVMLNTWPLTANGKLDRKALPAPVFAAEAGGCAAETPTEKALAALFADVLKLPDGNMPGADADFFRLGGDSLSAVQLLLAIEAHWHRNPGLGTLFAHATVGRLAAIIDEKQVGFDDGLKPMLPLATGDPSVAPLFLVHPAGGIAWGYRHLARAIADATASRSVWGLQSPGLDPARPLPTNIDELAEDYAMRVTALQPDGTIHLAGWSVGGIIAQAMAVALQQRGRKVGLVALLDAYPADCWRDEAEPTPQQALRALLAIAGEDPEGHPELDTREKLIAFLRAGDSALGNLPEAALEGVVRVVTDTNRLIRTHHHRPMTGTLLHLRAGHDHVDQPQLHADRWCHYAGRVDALEVPFLHADMTGAEATAHIAPILIARMGDKL